MPQKLSLIPGCAAVIQAFLVKLYGSLTDDRVSARLSQRAKGTRGEAFSMLAHARFVLPLLSVVRRSIWVMGGYAPPPLMRGRDEAAAWEVRIYCPVSEGRKR